LATPVGRQTTLSGRGQQNRWRQRERNLPSPTASCLVMCRQLRHGKQEVRSGHACSGDGSACAGANPNVTHARRAMTTINNCFDRPCRRRRSADCSGQACQLGRRHGITNTLRVSTSKRRINDVMSQCIQAYCTDVLYHVRVACILRHCNRSRRAIVH